MTQVFFREGRRLFLRLFGVLGTRAVIALCLLLSISVSMPAFQTLWFSLRGTAVDAVVVRQDAVLAADWTGDASRSVGGGLRMAPAQRLFEAVLHFKVGGRTYEVRSARRGPVHVYPLGSKQVVIYPASRPQLALLRAELPGFWAQSGLLLMGIVVGAGTVRWWWSMSRRRMRFRRKAGYARARAHKHAEISLGIAEQDAGPEVEQPVAERPDGRTAS